MTLSPSVFSLERSANFGTPFTVPAAGHAMCLAGSILPNPFTDRKLKCISCSEEFTFTAEEQSFFESKNFINDPKHCK
jgi:hypothetical protein